MQREPLAIVAGVRTPFAKAFGALADRPADELGRIAVEGVLKLSGLTPADVGEVVFGNVAGPPEASNVARVIALRAGIPWDRPAHTVNRNCASGMEALFSAWQIVAEGRADVVVAGGTESMSNVPFLWEPRMQKWLIEFFRARGRKKVSLLAGLRPGFFRPVPALEVGLCDPTCGLSMGQTAEVLAREFAISRAEQDAFALRSHQRATAAWQRCFFKGEVVPVPSRTGQGDALDQDTGPRPNQSLAALEKLPPLFDRCRGSVTAGNSCPITDGAAAAVVMPVARARPAGLEPLGYLRDYAIAGCDPGRMGLGPVFAIHKLLRKTGLSLGDFELFEINEAFAAQVLACLKALASREFAKHALGESEPVGEIDPERLNVNGGAIALGHPVGASGTRLVITLLRALRERGQRRGLASLCVGGGQGVAVWVETEPIDSRESRHG
ncbi:MAG: thiolase family protein [Deltaproteobacteria bacterium]